MPGFWESPGGGTLDPSYTKPSLPPQFPDPNNPPVGINLPFQPKPVTDAANPYDYWGTLMGILGVDATDPEFTQLKDYYGGRKNWKMPKKAQDMLTLASLMKNLGDETSASQLALQTLSMGFQQPKWDLNALFGPQLQQWGLGYGSSAPAAAPSRSGSSSSQSDLLASLAGMM